MTKPYLILSKSWSDSSDDIIKWLTKLPLTPEDILEAYGAVDFSSADSGDFQFNIGPYFFNVHQENEQRIIALNFDGVLKEAQAITEELEALKVLSRAAKHDLSSSIGNIGLQSEMMTMAGTKKPELLSQGLRSIKESVFTAENILEDLSQFAKLVQNDVVDCDIDDVLNYTKRLLEKEIQSSYTAIAHGTFRKIQFQPSRMLIIFKNIISNSIKYSGNLNPKLIIKDEMEEDYYTITFLDNGIGIPKSEMMTIFKPYSRAKNTKGIPGQGIGMSTVKSLMDSTGGQIKIVSPVLSSENTQPGTKVILKFPKNLIL